MASGVRAVRGTPPRQGLTPDAQYMGKVGLPHIVDRLLRHVLTAQPPDPRGVVRKIREACDEDLASMGVEPEGKGAGGGDPVGAMLAGKLSRDECLDALEALPSEDRRSQLAQLIDGGMRKNKIDAPAATTGGTSGHIGFGDAEVQCLSGETLYECFRSNAVKHVPGSTAAVMHLRDADNEVLYDPSNPASRAKVGAGVVGKVAEGNKTLAASFGAAHQLTDDDSCLLGAGAKHVVSAPITHPSKGVLGTLSVIGGDSAQFSADTNDKVGQLAVRAMPMLYAAQVASAKDETQKTVDVLLDVARRLASELELNSLIRVIMQVSRDLLGADRATLFLVDKDADQLYSSVADGTGEIRIPRNAGIAGAVATTAEPINIPSAYADSRFTGGQGPTLDKKNNFRTNSILCMPMQNKAGEVIGVTQMINKTSGSPFGKEDQRLLGAFSAQAAVAIENSLLFKRTEESKQLFENVLSSIKNMIITLDDKGNILTINRDPMAFGIGMDQDMMKTNTYKNWFQRRPETADSATGRDGGRRRSSSRMQPAIPPISDLYYNGLLMQDIGECYKTGKERQVTEFSYTVLKQEEGKDTLIEDNSLTINYRIMPLHDFDGKQMGVIIVLEDMTAEAQMMQTLGKYMSPELAAAALEGGTQLGGQQLPVSVLFVDIRNFTGLSERYSAAEVVETLNEYFNLMGGSVLDHGGIVDKYIGDAVMAVFGVPFPAEDDAERICRCALEMFELLDKWNATRVSNNMEEVRMGIGINSGDVVAGNIGFEKRMEYTVIGDGVNLSSRMEGATKEYKTKILITEFTQEQVADKFYCREVDCIRVVGKKKPVKIFDLQAEKGKEPQEGDKWTLKLKCNELYAEGLAAYRKVDWLGAKEKFAQAVELGDSTSKPMLDRVNFFIGDPIIAPKQGWDGVFDMISK